ncbi:DDB1- and CUL4-associated factor 8 isoform X1 [Monomorium pharaonis]|uniref:DDB1- and CUL4-associated factor 8 isoform X1 n=1 Tax=Monomorium pharaonis TaxID=307658 RepID=UPI0017467141|nr:DDB1- and CUL4-associated factor 8 isoform X1 [Monomorium pharaonis]
MKTTDKNEWDKERENEEKSSYSLKIKQSHIVQKVINRQIYNNKLFQRIFCNSLFAVERLTPIYKLEIGELNTIHSLNFNQKGNLLAACNNEIIIWDWATRKKLHCFRMIHSYQTTHDVKWLDKEYCLVTCTSEGQILLRDFEHNISKILAVHDNAAEKLAVPNFESSNTIFSAGIDGKVILTDIRESEPNVLLTVFKEGSLSKVALNDIRFNPLNNNEFCVSGNYNYINIYDQRKVLTPLYSLCPDHLTEDTDTNVTCVVYNDNGTEILASYRYKDIYLFDRLMSSPVSYTHKYQGHLNKTFDSMEAIFFGNEYVISGSECGNIFIWDKNTETIVQWIKADNKAVIHLKGHPHLPILATEGMDIGVKIWMPLGGEPPDKEALANCVKSNIKNRERQAYDDTYYGLDQDKDDIFSDYLFEWFI